MASEVETLISITCTCERGCVLCSHTGSVEALTPQHQYVAGWRHVVIDPADNDGNVHVWLTNRKGVGQKGLVSPEHELRALIHHGAAHFDRVDQVGAR